MKTHRAFNTNRLGALLLHNKIRIAYKCLENPPQRAMVCTGGFLSVKRWEPNFVPEKAASHIQQFGFGSPNYPQNSMIGRFWRRSIEN